MVVTLHQIKDKHILRFHQILAANNIYLFCRFSSENKILLSRRTCNASIKAYKLKMEGTFSKIAEPLSVLISTER